jgi:uncharacterized membrane protein
MKTLGVFISYASEDAERARELQAALVQRRVRCWIDRDMKPGVFYPEEIVEGIRGCDVFVILLSKASCESIHVLKELQLAFEHKKRIVPIKISDVDIPAAMLYQLIGVNWATWQDVGSGMHPIVLKIVGPSRRKSEVASVERWVPDEVATINIAASDDLLYKIVSDLERYPRWQQGVRSVAITERTEQGQPKSAAWVVGVPMMPFLQLRYTLAYVHEPPSRLSFRAVPNASVTSMIGTYQFIPRGDSTCQAVCSLRVRLNVPHGVVQQFLRLATHSMLDQLDKEALRRRADLPHI